MNNTSSQFESKAAPDPEIAAQMGGLPRERFEFPDEEEQLQPVGAYEPPIDPSGNTIDTSPDRLPEHWSAAERRAHWAALTAKNLKYREGLGALSVEQHMQRIQEQTGEDGTFNTEAS